MDKATKDIMTAYIIDKTLTPEQRNTLAKKWYDLGEETFQEWYLFLLENAEIKVEIK
jgi:hypothetical protein